MKNLKFGSLALDTIQTLSRNEAKKIVGGYGPKVIPPGSTVCQYTCTTLLGNRTEKTGPPNTDPCSWYEATAVGPCN